MALFSLLKILMFLFNSIIFFGGLGLLGIGLCLKIDGSSLTDFLGVTVSPFTQLLVVRYLCIVIGSILLLLGILGCWGAIRENKSLLLLFFIIILTLFLVKMASAMIILIFSSTVNVLFAHIDSWAVRTLQESYDKKEDITKMWNTTMKEGCLHKLKESLEKNGKLIGGVGLGISVFEVAAMVVSIILFFKIDDISYG
uniref:Tetraspanin-16 isoform X2 n=1 Tax=Phascolarctos cinereus TaxID=38626 RepID=A0A6P5KYQ9_PHACI|nr:tetraspanin-16 isoform X2 [Phascolarctos cinereus]